MGKDKEWYIIKMIEKRLLIYASIDFFLQVLTQMPLVDYANSSTMMDHFGFRKIWNNHGDSAYDFDALIR